MVESTCDRSFLTGTSFYEEVKKFAHICWYENVDNAMYNFWKKNHY